MEMDNVKVENQTLSSMISDNERHMNALALHLEKDATNTFWINQMLNDEIER